MKAPHDSSCKLSGFGGGSPSRVWITISRNGEVSLVFIKCSSTKRRLPVRVVTIVMGLALLSSCASAVAQTDQTTGQSIARVRGALPQRTGGSCSRKGGPALPIRNQAVRRPRALRGKARPECKRRQKGLEKRSSSPTNRIDLSGGRFWGPLPAPPHRVKMLSVPR